MSLRANPYYKLHEPGSFGLLSLKSSLHWQTLPNFCLQTLVLPKFGYVCGASLPMKLQQTLQNFCLVKLVKFVLTMESEGRLRLAASAVIIGIAIRHHRLRRSKKTAMRPPEGLRFRSPKEIPLFPNLF